MTDFILRSDLSRTRFLVGASGGEITAHDADGEVQWTIGLSPGIHEGRKYEPFMQAFWSVQTGRDVTAMVDQTRRARSNPPPENSTQSGANPDFKPSLATREEARMRQIEKRLQATEQRAAKMVAQAEMLAARAQEAAPAETPASIPSPQTEEVPSTPEETPPNE